MSSTPVGGVYEPRTKQGAFVNATSAQECSQAQGPARSSLCVRVAGALGFSQRWIFVVGGARSSHRGEGFRGGSLLCLCFLAARAVADLMPVDGNPDGEPSGVGRAGLADDFVGGQRQPFPLDGLLERGFCVAGCAFRAESLDPLAQPLDDELPSLLLPLVYEDCAQNGFQRCGKVSGAATTSAGLFALAEEEVGSQIELLRNLRQRFPTYQGRAGTTEVALVIAWVARIQLAGDDPAEEGISKVLEPVITDEAGVLLLVEEGAVRQRLTQQLLFLEPYTERSFELSPIVCYS